MNRGIHEPDGNRLDLNLAASGRLYSDYFEETCDLIREAAKEKRWLILFGHDVRDAPSEFGCTPDELAKWLELIASLSLDVLPVRDALDRVQA